MVTFRSNNNRRPPFRSNNNRRPPFRRGEEGSKFSNNSSFKRNVPGRNNHNAAKLIEKYNEMAREALANEDRVLSENYFQHADHFTRVQKEQESARIARINSSSVNVEKPIKTESEVLKDDVKSVKKEEEEKTTSESEITKVSKTSEKKPEEKKSVAG